MRNLYSLILIVSFIFSSLLLECNKPSDTTNSTDITISKLDLKPDYKLIEFIYPYVHMADKDGSSIYINIITNAQYSLIPSRPAEYEYNKGLFLDYADEGIYYYDSNLQKLNDTPYTHATLFYEGIAAASQKEGEILILNDLGEIIKTFQVPGYEIYGTPYFIYNNYLRISPPANAAESVDLNFEVPYFEETFFQKVQLLNIETGEIVKLPYFDLAPSGNGYFIVRKVDPDTGRTMENIVDSNFKEILSQDYPAVLDAKNGYAVVNIEKYGVINFLGEVVITPNYNNILFSTDNHILCLNEYTAAIGDLTTGTVTELPENVIYNLNGRLLIATDTNWKSQISDFHGTVLTPPIHYEHIWQDNYATDKMIYMLDKAYYLIEQ